MSIERLPRATEPVEFQALLQRALAEVKRNATQRQIASAMHVAESTLADWKSAPGRRPGTVRLVEDLETALRQAGADLAPGQLVAAWEAPVNDRTHLPKVTRPGRTRWLDKPRARASTAAVAVIAVTMSIVAIRGLPPSDDATEERVPTRIYSITNDSNRGAAPFQIEPEGYVEQAFRSPVPNVIAVSLVIGRDPVLASPAPPDGQPIGAIEVEILGPDGALVAEAEAQALNNVDTVVKFDKPVHVDIAALYSARVTNASPVILGYYCAPSPAGYEQALADRGFNFDGPMATGGNRMSLTAVILGLP